MHPCLISGQSILPRSIAKALVRAVLFCAVLTGPTAAQQVPDHLIQLSKSLVSQLDPDDFAALKDTPLPGAVQDALRETGLRNFRGSAASGEGLSDLADALGLDLGKPDHRTAFDDLLSATTRADRIDAIAGTLQATGREASDQNIQQGLETLQNGLNDAAGDLERDYTFKLPDGKDVTIEWDPGAGDVSMTVDHNDGSGSTVIHGGTPLSVGENGEANWAETEPDNAPVTHLTDEFLDQIAQYIFGIWKASDGRTIFVAPPDGRLPDPVAFAPPEAIERQAELQARISELENTRVWVWRAPSGGLVINDTDQDMRTEGDYTYLREESRSFHDEDIAALQAEIDRLAKDISGGALVDQFDPLGIGAEDSAAKTGLRMWFVEGNGYRGDYDAASFDGRRVTARRIIDEQKEFVELNTDIPVSVRQDLLNNWKAPNWSEITASYDARNRTVRAHLIDWWLTVSYDRDGSTANSIQDPYERHFSLTRETSFDIEDPQYVMRLVSETGEPVAEIEHEKPVKVQIEYLTLPEVPEPVTLRIDPEERQIPSAARLSYPQFFLHNPEASDRPQLFETDLFYLRSIQFRERAFEDGLYHADRYHLESVLDQQRANFETDTEGSKGLVASNFAGEWLVSRQTPDGKGQLGSAEVAEDGSSVRLALANQDTHDRYQSFEMRASGPDSIRIRFERVNGFSPEDELETGLEPLLEARIIDVPTLATTALFELGDEERKLIRPVRMEPAPVEVLNLLLTRSRGDAWAGAFRTEFSVHGETIRGQESWSRNPEIRGAIVLQDQASRTESEGTYYAHRRPTRGDVPPVSDSTHRLVVDEARRIQRGVDLVRSGATQNTRQLFVFGKNLPTTFGDAFIIDNKTPGLSYQVRFGDLIRPDERQRGMKRAMELAEARGETFEGSAEDYDILVFDVEYDESVKPGSHVFHINGVPISWYLTFADATTRFYFTRTPPAEGNPTQLAFAGDELYLEMELEADMPVEDELELRLHFNGISRDTQSQQQVVQLSRVTEVDVGLGDDAAPIKRPLYRSPPIQIYDFGDASTRPPARSDAIVFAVGDPVQPNETSPEDRAAQTEAPAEPPDLGPAGDPSNAGLTPYENRGDRDAARKDTPPLAELIATWDQPALLRSARPARVAIWGSPGDLTRNGEEQTTWTEALVRARQCHSNAPGGLIVNDTSEEYSRVIITEFGSRGIPIKLGDHAAMILVAEEYRRMSSERIKVYQHIAENPKEFLDSAIARGPSSDPIWQVMSVTVRNEESVIDDIAFYASFGNLADGQRRLGDLLDFEDMERRFPQVREEGGRAFLERHFQEAIEAYIASIRKSIETSRTNGDCGMDLLLTLTTRSQPEVVNTLLPRLMRPITEETEDAIRVYWGPDLVAHAYVRTLHQFGDAVRSLDAYSDLDTTVVALTFAAAGGAAAFVAAQAGALAVATYITIGFDVADVLIFGTIGALEYEDKYGTVEFAEGQSAVFGAGVHQEALAGEPSLFWTAAGVILPGVGVYSSFGDLRHLADIERGRDIARGFNTIDAGRLRSLDDADQRAFQAYLEAMNELRKISEATGPAGTLGRTFRLDRINIGDADLAFLDRFAEFGVTRRAKVASGYDLARKIDDVEIDDLSRLNADELEDVITFLEDVRVRIVTLEQGTGGGRIASLGARERVLAGRFADDLDPLRARAAELRAGAASGAADAAADGQRVEPPVPGPRTSDTGGSRPPQDGDPDDVADAGNTPPPSNSGGRQPVRDGAGNGGGNAPASDVDEVADAADGSRAGDGARSAEGGAGTANNGQRPRNGDDGSTATARDTAQPDPPLRAGDDGPAPARGDDTAPPPARDTNADSQPPRDTADASPPARDTDVSARRGDAPDTPRSSGGEEDVMVAENRLDAAPNRTPDPQPGPQPRPQPGPQPNPRADPQTGAVESARRTPDETPLVSRGDGRAPDIEDNTPTQRFDRSQLDGDDGTPTVFLPAGQGDAVAQADGDVIRANQSIVVKDRFWREITLDLDDAISQGAIHSVFAIQGEPGLIARISAGDAYSRGKIFDDYAWRALDGVKDDNFRLAKRHSRFETDPGTPNSRVVEIVERVSGTAADQVRANPGGTMTPGQAAAMDGAMRSLNRQGLVWADNHTKNFVFEQIGDDDTWRAVIFDPGGMIKMSGTPDEAAATARDMQRMLTEARPDEVGLIRQAELNGRVAGNTLKDMLNTGFQQEIQARFGEFFDVDAMTAEAGTLNRLSEIPDFTSIAFRADRMLLEPKVQELFNLSDNAVGEALQRMRGDPLARSDLPLARITEVRDDIARRGIEAINELPLDEQRAVQRAARDLAGRVRNAQNVPLNGDEIALRNAFDKARAGALEESAVYRSSSADLSKSLDQAEVLPEANRTKTLRRNLANIAAREERAAFTRNLVNMAEDGAGMSEDTRKGVGAVASDLDFRRKVMQQLSDAQDAVENANLRLDDLDASLSSAQSNLADLESRGVSGAALDTARRQVTDLEAETKRIRDDIAPQQNMLERTTDADLDWLSGARPTLSGEETARALTTLQNNNLQWAKMLKDKTLSPAQVHQMSYWRNATVDRMLARAIEPVAARTGRKIDPLAFGSNNLTSDYDLSIRIPDGEPGASEIIASFNRQFRETFGAESGVVFDTNVYSEPAYTFFAPVRRAIDDFENVDGLSRAVEEQSALRRTMDDAAWDAHKAAQLSQLDGDALAQARAVFDDVDAIETRAIQSDAIRQRMYSETAQRRYMTDAEWDTHKTNMLNGTTDAQSRALNEVFNRVENNYTAVRAAERTEQVKAIEDIARRDDAFKGRAADDILDELETDYRRLSQDQDRLLRETPPGQLSDADAARLKQVERIMDNVALQASNENYARLLRNTEQFAAENNRIARIDVQSGTALEELRTVPDLARRGVGPNELNAYGRTLDRMADKIAEARDLDRRGLEATEAWDEARRLQDDALDTLTEQVRNRQGMALFYASEAYQTDGAIAHVVGELQAGGRKITPETLRSAPVNSRLSADQYFDSFGENRANMFKEVGAQRNPITTLFNDPRKAAAKASKYMIRQLDAANQGGLNLRALSDTGDIDPRIIDATFAVEANRGDLDAVDRVLRSLNMSAEEFVDLATKTSDTLTQRSFGRSALSQNSEAIARALDETDDEIRNLLRSVEDNPISAEAAAGLPLANRVDPEDAASLRGLDQAEQAQLRKTYEELAAFNRRNPDAMSSAESAAFDRIQGALNKVRDQDQIWKTAEPVNLPRDVDLRPGQGLEIANDGLASVTARLDAAQDYVAVVGRGDPVLQAELLETINDLKFRQKTLSGLADQIRGESAANAALDQAQEALRSARSTGDTDAIKAAQDAVDAARDARRSRIDQGSAINLRDIEWLSGTRGRLSPQDVENALDNLERNGFRWNKVLKDPTISNGELHQLTTLRRMDVNQRLDRIINEVAAETGHRPRRLAFGSNTLTSDYDLSIRLEDGPGASEVVRRFNSEFRAQYGAESGTVFDTNVYTEPSYSFITSTETSARGAVDLDAIETDRIRQVIHRETKIRRFASDAEWDAHQELSINAMETAQGRQAMRRILNEADQAHQRGQAALENGLADRLGGAEDLRALRNDIADARAAGRNDVVNELQLQLDDLRLQTSNDIYGDVLSEIDNTMRHFQAVQDPSLTRDFDKITEIGEAIDDIDPSVALKVRASLLEARQAARRAQDAGDAGTQLIEDALAEASLNEAAATLARHARNKQGEALYFASEAYYTEGAIQHVVGEIQAGGADVTAEALRAGPRPSETPRGAYLDSFYENRGDTLKELSSLRHLSSATGYSNDEKAAAKASKYFIRQLDAANQAGLDIANLPHPQLIEATVAVNEVRGSPELIAGVLDAFELTPAQFADLTMAASDLLTKQAVRVGAVSENTSALAQQSRRQRGRFIGSELVD